MPTAAKHAENKSAFLRGMGSILSVWGTPKSANFAKRHRPKSDFESLAGDWLRVGQDIAGTALDYSDKLEESETERPVKISTFYIKDNSDTFSLEFDLQRRTVTIRIVKKSIDN